jgi:hypothetical protein
VNRPSDKAYSTALMVGLCLMGAGLFLAMLMFVVGAIQSARMGGSNGLPIFAASGVFTAIFLAGVLTTGVTLVAGMRRATFGAKSVWRVDGARVQARYCVNHLGETIFQEEYIDFEDPQTRFFVRLEIPGRGTSEYRCAAPVWGQCGEGLTGNALVQGDWVSQFVRDIGDGRGNPYRSDVAEDVSRHL